MNFGARNITEQPAVATVRLSAQNAHTAKEIVKRVLNMYAPDLYDFAVREQKWPYMVDDNARYEALMAFVTRRVTAYNARVPEDALEIPDMTDNASFYQLFIDQVGDTGFKLPLPTEHRIRTDVTRINDLFGVLRTFFARSGVTPPQDFCGELVQRLQETNFVESYASASSDMSWLNCADVVEPEGHMTRTPQWTSLEKFLRREPDPRDPTRPLLRATALVASELLCRFGGNYTWESRTRASMNLSRCRMVFGPDYFVHVTFQGRNYYLMGEKHYPLAKQPYLRVEPALSVMQFVNDIVTLKSDEAFDVFVENTLAYPRYEEVTMVFNRIPSILQFFAQYFDVLNLEPHRYRTHILPNVRLHTMDLRRQYDPNKTDNMDDPLIREAMLDNIPFPHKKRLIPVAQPRTFAQTTLFALGSIPTWHTTTFENVMRTIEYETRDLPEETRVMILEFARADLPRRIAQKGVEAREHTGMPLEEEYAEFFKHAIYTDYYAIARMIRKFVGNETGNVFVYAGCAHIKTYVDFFQHAGATIVARHGRDLNKIHEDQNNGHALFDDMTHRQFRDVILRDSFRITEDLLALDIEEANMSWMQFLFSPATGWDDFTFWRKNVQGMIKECVKEIEGEASEEIKGYGDTPDVQRELFMQLFFVLKKSGVDRSFATALRKRILREHAHLFAARLHDSYVDTYADKI